MGAIFRTIGPPGCGKTTYLCGKAAEAADRFGRDRVLICSLTKAAARAVQDRGLDLPKHAVGTMHAHCYRMLGRPELAESHIPEWNASHGALALSGGRDQLEGHSDGAIAGETPADWLYSMVCSSRAGGRDIPDQAAAFWNAWSAWKQEKGYLDFEDLIEVARRDCATAPGHPAVVYLDEAQDSSASEIGLIQHWSRTASVVVVGDLDQSIFEFRGACPQAFADLNVPDERRRVLEQSYRVPRAVHGAAVRWIEQVQGRERVIYRPRDADGELRRVPWCYGHAERLLAEAQPYLDAGKSVMFLGACNWHLAPLIAVMRREGVPFWNPYRLTDGRWNPLAVRGGVTAAQRLEAFLEPATAGRWSLGGLSRWLESVQAKAVLADGAKAKIKRWIDAGEFKDFLPDDEAAALFQPGILSEAVGAAWDRRWDWLLERVLPSKRKAFEFPVQVATKHGIEALSKDPQIIVGTIHSTKGGEADVVFVFPDLSRKGLAEWCSPSGRDQVIRLFYVAMTRARESLILCAPTGPMHVQWN